MRRLPQLMAATSRPAARRAVGSRSSQLWSGSRGSNKTAASTTPAPICSPRRGAGSSRTRGTSTSRRASASASTARDHATESTAGRSSTWSRCMTSEIRAASPLTPTEMLLTAVPMKVASSATHQRVQATGRSKRYHAQPRARGDRRLMSRAATSNPPFTLARAWRVVCHGNWNSTAPRATAPVTARVNHTHRGKYRFTRAPRTEGETHTRGAGRLR